MLLPRSSVLVESLGEPAKAFSETPPKQLLFRLIFDPANPGLISSTEKLHSLYCRQACTGYGSSVITSSFSRQLP